MTIIFVDKLKVEKLIIVRIKIKNPKIEKGLSENLSANLPTD